MPDKSKAKRTKKEKRPEAPKAQAPVVSSDLKDIHMVYDLAGLKVLVVEASLDENGNGTVSLENAKDISDEFIHTNSLIANSHEEGDPQIVHHFTDTNELFTVYLKMPKGTSIADIEHMLKAKKRKTK